MSSASARTPGTRRLERVGRDDRDRLARRTPGSTARSGDARRERELALGADHGPHARNCECGLEVERADAPVRDR